MFRLTLLAGVRFAFVVCSAYLLLRRLRLRVLRGLFPLLTFSLPLGRPHMLHKSIASRTVLLGLRTVLLGLRTVLLGLRTVLSGLRTVLSGLPCVQYCTFGIRTEYLFDASCL